MCKLIGNDTCRHVSRDIWLIIIVWNGFFWGKKIRGDTPCCQNKANPVSHRTPWIPPPPSQQKSHMLSQYYYIWSLCWRRFAIEGEGLPHGITPPPPGEVLLWDFFRGKVFHMVLPPLGKFCYGISSGGRFAIWYYPPPGEVLLWDFFRGKVCHKVFLHGERLPYGIISEGTICHGICSLIKKCVCVWGGGSTIEGEALP